MSFASSSIRPAGGFYWQAADGTPLPGRRPLLFLTARMTHVASVAVNRGIPDADRLLTHGVESLLGLFHDARHGGWISDPLGDPLGRKAGYDHVHVGLAAASALTAGAPRSEELLDGITRVINERFWLGEEPAVAESYAVDWTDPEPYRGANAAMHSVEAFIALGDATGDSTWHERAYQLADKHINYAARENNWLIPEHFRLDGSIDADYNIDEPMDPFRPYGATPGHAFEWARLILQLGASSGLPASAHTDWIEPAASALCEQAFATGWGSDGLPGLVYTTDFTGKPIATARLHWPICEAIQATAALWRATGEESWREWFERSWQFAEHFIDPQTRAWVNEIDAQLRPSELLWPGRPDVYHATGALLGPDLPLSPFLTAAVKR